MKKLNKEQSSQEQLNENIDKTYLGRSDEKEQYKKDAETTDEKKSGIIKYLAPSLFVLSILYIGFSSSPVMKADEAAGLLEKGISTSAQTGTVLFSKDQTGAAKDYVITHNSNQNESLIYVWDYAAEDGDYVQVFVNDLPLSEPFMIRHKPKVFTVPANGNVIIKGIRDGGGGITYAVHFAINSSTYFNNASNVDNSYKLVRNGSN